MEEKPLILIVDDNDDARMLASMILNKNGFQCVSAANGREALHIMQSGTLPNLILSDIMMPEMNGYEFFESVQEKPDWRRIPFIFFSLKDSMQDIQKGRQLGVDDYLTKPIMPDALLAAVRGKLKRFRQLGEVPSTEDKD